MVTYRALASVHEQDARFAYQGHFHLTEPKIALGRYKKTQPPKSLSGKSTQKEADFIQFGHKPGALCIECKNYREWIYPHHPVISELIIKAHDLGAIPVLIARRLHYTTKTNFLEPAGIIAHETYYQYYPADQAELAAKVQHARSLGFTDVLATEEPHGRTLKFFHEILPKIVEPMAAKWKTNASALRAYALDQINLAELYTAIGSPAGGKWVDFTKANEE